MSTTVAPLSSSPVRKKKKRMLPPAPPPPLPPLFDDEDDGFFIRTNSQVHVKKRKKKRDTGVKKRKYADDDADSGVKSAVRAALATTVDSDNISTADCKTTPSLTQRSSSPIELDASGNPRQRVQMVLSESDSSDDENIFDLDELLPVGRRGRRRRQGADEGSSGNSIHKKEKVVRIPTLSPPPTLSKAQLESMRKLVYMQHGQKTQPMAASGTVASAKATPSAASRLSERLRSASNSSTPMPSSAPKRPIGPTFPVTVLVETTTTVQQAFKVLLSPTSDANIETLVRAGFFKIKSAHPFSKVRTAWLDQVARNLLAVTDTEESGEGIDETAFLRVARDMVLLDKTTLAKCYDDGTPAQVGVKPEEPHMSLLAVMRGEVESLRADFCNQLEDLAEDDEEDAEGKKTADTAATDDDDEDKDGLQASTADVDDGGMRVFLQDGVGEPLNLKVKPELIVSRIVDYYRQKRNVPMSKVITLEIDDEPLDAHDIVASTEIEDEITIDVKVR
ncbi:uncharacterized protein V1518DRAFT_419329 [Limtongia smithiae]|uniref:uncharacterized protein n=1 Tax=Limtongia smithiae TaxID=1125753 RepID=UPI0034CFECA0